ncbi:MAG: acyl-ACP--UDP-N-acetylglucosamine O-acyltransferase [Candidatus Marinimicrobia bacterium]|nr:acyl-ACP--UDP-N-acetylglucosamine O-acyltransferase [Candidatus Neomarinimicrobiota bacterium]MBT3633925.1 acyl-ACP--UDP-N-acetylglucosamine O-acyltransferase [Candidatus Neomarinimicrobiota bacterium]MBT3682826.1 acyl-ACP--UDP-N-acetylglucosamine O-acyltransferase [Candidatus Neomarinimicrobiota bacterium]MBT3759987.1 acyl-ACP--UDP-N-acetylglucosamine O-acyltransferase [Candidatus Neomarinimicrobiota bacterium]MBT3896081.1 acyl-ACP--UDP-N-acetylglucosamine O-acyltransferase [Candidatus Neom
MKEHNISTKIHPTAIIHPDSVIGSEVEIGPFSIVEENCVIGNGTKIHEHVIIKTYSTIGKECEIFQGAVIGGIPQDLKFGGEKSKLIIGDRTRVREYCTLNRGTEALGKTSIGSDVLLMAYVHIGHDCIIEDNAILANGISLGGHVEVGYHAIIGGHTPVHQFCKIGEHAFVGGAYRVVKDIPPYITATGEPMRFAGLNFLGLKRRNFSPETRAAIKKAYKIIFRSEYNISQSIDYINKNLKIIPEITKILNFIENSNRGII